MAGTRPGRFDRADAGLVQARRQNPNSGIFEYYRRLAEGAGGQLTAREPRVRLRVPSRIGRINMLHPNFAADGTVEMLESEAESFLRAGWVRVDDRLP
jgi:hypothetical protein